MINGFSSYPFEAHDKLTEAEALLKRFEPISLEQMDAVSLMKRKDTKFTFNINLLPALLKELEGAYYVFEISEHRSHLYKNIYYDTPDFLLYALHQRGKANRYKIRIRRYEESALNFLEIKLKDNKGNTDKTRRKIKGYSAELSENSKNFLLENSPFTSEQIRPAIEIQYKRITLVNKKMDERCTLDMGLTFYNGEKAICHNSMVIMELKQARFNVHSLIMKLTKKMGIHPYSVSKYCMGIFSLYPFLKSHSFKAQIKQINKLVYGTTQLAA